LDTLFRIKKDRSKGNLKMLKKQMNQQKMQLMLIPSI